jgi:polyferredoxin
MLYGALMSMVAVFMIVGLATRQTLDLNVIRDRSPPFVRLADGSVRNDYALKLINMTDRARRLEIEVVGLAGAHLQSAERERNGALIAEAGADGVTNVRIHVVAPAHTPAGSHDITFTVRDVESGDVAASQSAFLTGAAP